MRMATMKLMCHCLTLLLPSPDRDGGECGFLPSGAVLSSSGGSVGKMYTFHVVE